MPKTNQGLSFSRNTTYYRQPTHEFNIPSGWSCPGAHDCLTKVDKDTGKRTQTGPKYVCYSTSASTPPATSSTPRTSAYGYAPPKPTPP